MSSSSNQILRECSWHDNIDKHGLGLGHHGHCNTISCNKLLRIKFSGKFSAGSSTQSQSQPSPTSYYYPKSQQLSRQIILILIGILLIGLLINTQLVSARPHSGRSLSRNRQKNFILEAPKIPPTTRCPTGQNWAGNRCKSSFRLQDEHRHRHNHGNDNNK